jgi:hypothetical protein
MLDSAGQMTSEARETASRMLDKTGNMAGEASRAVQTTLRNGESRDALLLGVAALAVAAAVGISYQRRAE